MPFEEIHSRPARAPAPPPAAPRPPAPHAPTPAPASSHTLPPAGTPPADAEWERPLRPAWATAAGVIFLVLGVGALLMTAGAVFFLAALFTSFGASGAEFLLLAALALPFGALPLAVGIGILRGRPWARYGGIALAIVTLLSLGSLSGLAALQLPPGEASALIGTQLLAPAGAAVALYALLRRDVREHFTTRERGFGLSGEAATGRAAAAGWKSLAALHAFAVLALALVASFPLSSLRSSADGSRLASEALIGAAVGLLAIAAGVMLLSRASRTREVGAVAGISLAAGGAGALLQVGAAQALARMPLIDGRVESDPYYGLLIAGALCWAAAVAVLLANANDPRAAATRLGGATGLAFGTMIGATCAYLLSEEQPLRAAAAARPRHETPGLELVLLVATLAAMAWLRRGRV